jgi:hypothetical protein
LIHRVDRKSEWLDGVVYDENVDNENVTIPKKIHKKINDPTLFLFKS